MKNAKTPLMRILRKLSNAAQLSKKTGISAKELLNPDHPVYSRRDFLKTTAKAGVMFGIGSSVPLISSCAFDDHKTTAEHAVAAYDCSIAIIGGGIAGLHACHILKKYGFAATVYEGSNRTGGRMLSVHNVMGDNLVTEFGGEYLDTNHRTMFDLMKEFNLETLDTLPSLKDLTSDDIFIDGTHYSVEQAITEFNKINTLIEADLVNINDDYRPGSYADTLDSLSIDDYLVKVGCTGWFKEFIQAAYESEFGCSTGELSALNFITFIDTDTRQGDFNYFGDSDERYKVKGGNQQVVDKLADANKNSILTGHILTRIAREGEAYTLTFANGREATADYVIMAIPFTMLRKVEMALEMAPEKKNAIQSLNYGTNAKMMFGMDKRVWRDQGYGGYLFSNLVQNGWDNSLAQNGDTGYGGYTVYLGGAAGKNLNRDEYDKYLDGIDQAYHGAKAAHNGKRAIMHWPRQPFVMGSYACFTKGQFVHVKPHIATPVGNIYFAGEHCSEEFQGFMEGGAETGKKAAEVIIKSCLEKRRARVESFI